MDATKAIIITNFDKCARCGDPHASIELLPLKQPGRETHWGYCPKNSEPIIVAFVGQEN